MPKKDYLNDLIYQPAPANYVQPMPENYVQPMPEQPVQVNYVQPIPAQPQAFQPVPVQPVQQAPVNYVQAPVNYVQPIPRQQAPVNYVQPIPAQYYPAADPANFEADVLLGPTTVKDVPKADGSQSVYAKRWGKYKQDMEANAKQPDSMQSPYEARAGAYKEDGKLSDKVKEVGGTMEGVPLPPSLARGTQQSAGLPQSTFSRMKDQNRELDRKTLKALDKGVGIQAKEAANRARMYGALEEGLEKAYDDEMEQIGRLRDGYKDDQGNVIDGFNQKFNNLMQDLDNTYKEFSTEKLDSNRLFSNMGTGRRILVGIGLFLSAFNNKAMTNSLNLIEKAINRDIAEQKYNINRKRYAAADKKNQLDLLMKKYDNDIIASNSLALLQKKKVIDTIDAQIRRSNSKTEIGKLELLKAEMLQSMKKNAGKISDLQLRLEDTRVKMENADPIKQQILLKTSLVKSDPIRGKALDDVTKFRQEEGALKQIDQVFDDFLRKDKEGVSAFMSAMPTTKDKAQRVTAFARFFGPIKVYIDEAVTKGELEIFDSFIPKVTDGEDALKFKRDAFKQALLNKFPQKTYANMLLDPRLKLTHRRVITEKKPKTR